MVGSLSSSDLDDNLVDLYEGRIKIVRIDENRLDELETILDEFLGEVSPDEKVVVNTKNDVMTVRILKS